MSRSYRHQPFAAITGSKSAKQDKIMAHRGVRRAQNYATRLMLRDENVLMPHRLECSWNEVYSWGRDGHQSWQYPGARDWSRYLAQVNRTYPYDCNWYDKWLRRNPPQWPPEWYVKMLRK